jgi:hypothetical protein
MRHKCFCDVNRDPEKSKFSMSDYQLILEAIQRTNRHLRDLVLFAMTEKLSRRNAG